MDSTEAPIEYRNAGIGMMVAGAMNIVLSLLWMVGFIGGIWTACLCVLPIPCFVVGVLEIKNGNDLRKGIARPKARLVSIAGALSGLVMCFGLVPCAIEVVVFMLLRSDHVRPWLDAQEAARVAAAPEEP